MRFFQGFSIAMKPDFFVAIHILLVFLISSRIAGFATDEFPKEFAKGSWNFTLNLLKSLTNESDENILMSPSSISVLLSILQQGANENTSTQLEEVLQITAEDSAIGFGQVIKSFQREKTNLTLEWGNSVYIAPEFEINENFSQAVKENFNASIETLNLTNLTNAVLKINDWVKEVTHEYIKDLVDESALTPDFAMIMINVIFFKSIWDSPFHKYKTRVDKFHVNVENKTEVPFMRQAGRFNAGENSDLGFKWTELPFKDPNFSMIFILPIKIHSLDQVIEKLSGINMYEIIENSNTRRVNMAIPKFKLIKKVSLKEPLQKLGLTDIFTNDSDLRNISDGGEILKLSRLIHHAHVEIDEDGSTATAATLEVVQTLSLEWFTDEIQFHANHPFLFFIVDKENKIPIFAGKISDPTNSVL